MIIDSHIHFWKFDMNRDSWITDNMKILRQDYLPEQLALTLKRNEVDGCVAVQADQSEQETHFLVELSKSHTEIKGVVGWIDLQHKNIEERLQYFSQFNIIKGWRHIVQAEPVDFLLNENFHRGITAIANYNYSYDILISHQQLKPALEFVSKFPGQKFVIDHCAKPDIGNKKSEPWKALIKEMAKYPNVYCKLSGLLTEAKWKHWRVEDFYPYFDVVFEAFGTDRLLFGSDWPVIQLSGNYEQWINILEKYMEHYAEIDRMKVFRLNAIEFYKL